jgi:hypothetical protein
MTQLDADQSRPLPQSALNAPQLPRRRGRCVSERDSAPGVVSACSELSTEFAFAPSAGARTVSLTLTAGRTLPLPWHETDRTYSFTLTVATPSPSPPTRAPPLSSEVVQDSKR